MGAPLKARLLLAAIKQVPGGEELHLVSDAAVNRFKPDPTDPANEWLRLSPSATLKLFVADAAQWGTHKPGETLVIELRAITAAELARRADGVKAVADETAAARAAKAAARTAAARPALVPVVPVPAPVPSQNVKVPGAMSQGASAAPAAATVPPARTNTP